MHQPKIADEQIQTLNHWAKRLHIPMTRLANRLLEHGIAQLEQGVEQVNEPAVQDDARKTRRAKHRARSGTPSSTYH